MRILHIVGDSKFGGGSIIIWRLAELAKQLGWQVDVLTTDLKFQNLLRQSNIGIVNLKVIWRDINPPRDLWGLICLTNFLKRENYHLVHTHTSKAGFIGRFAAWLAHVPIIVHTVHGFAFHEQSSILSLKFYASLERLAAQWCDLLVTVSEFHRDWALNLRIGDPQKVIAIPNGLNEARLKPTRSRKIIKAELGVKEKEILILSIGRLATQKGFEYLVKAVPFLKKKQIPPFHIIIVGEGPLRGKLELLIKHLNVEREVRLLGFREDIGDLLNASDLIVLPSLWEGLSIALLEAMAASKPIVTTSIGSNVEVTRNGEAALLVPPKDPLVLSEAILYLIENPSVARKLAVRARQIYEQNYTEEKMLQKYKQEYLRLIKIKGLDYS